ncbi:MAG: PKD domain-containing protein [Candidatus Nanoarchaeia archaeon]
MEKNEILKIVIALLTLVCLSCLMNWAHASNSEYFLKVNVLDINNNIINTANIYVYDSSNVQVGASSSGTGTFILPEGNYKIKANASGYNENSTEIDLNENRVVNLTLTKASTNNPPVAKLVYAIDSNNLLLVHFNASKSYDPDGDTLSYGWDFGDGTSNVMGGPTMSHTYSAYGTYTAKVIVFDSNGGSDIASVTFTLTGTVPIPNAPSIIVKDLDFKDEVKPGETIEFELELKNNATESSAYATNVNAEIIIKDIDAGSDLKEKIDFGDILAGKYKKEIVAFEIPFDAKAKNYVVKVIMEWQDQNGNYYQTEWTSPNSLEVNRPKHQILITDIQSSKNIYYPGETGQFVIALLNTGSSDENVQVKLALPFGLSETSAVTKLKSGDDLIQYLTFTIPEDVKPGKYFANIIATYGSNVVTKSFIIEIKAQSASNINPITIVEPKETGSESLSNADLLTIVLLVVVAILAALIAWFGKDLIAPKPHIISRRR